MDAGAELEPPGQIQLEEIVVIDRVDLRYVLVAAAGAEVLVDPFAVAIADRPDDVVGETVGKRGEDSFQAATELPSRFYRTATQ
jgi:hypothetical protein